MKYKFFYEVSAYRLERAIKSFEEKKNKELEPSGMIIKIKDIIPLSIPGKDFYEAILLYKIKDARTH